LIFVTKLVLKIEMSPYYSSKVYFDELVLKDIILSPNKEFHKN